VTKLTKSLIVGIVLALFVADPALADRRNSLANNILITDQDDVFHFPQLALDYRNLINFDWGTSAAEGSGMLLLGNSQMAYGVLINRADANGNAAAGVGFARDYELWNIGRRGTPFAELNGPNLAAAPQNFADAILAIKSGPNKFGFRLGIGHTLAYSEAGDNEDSDAVTTIKLTAGGSFGKNMDMAADINYATGATQRADNDVAQGALFGLDAKLRGFGMGSKYRLGYFGRLNVASQNIHVEAGDFNEIRLDFALQGGLGPVYKLDTMKATIAAYATVGFASSAQEPNDDADDDEAAAQTILFPGFKMSGEWELLKWLMFRTGMEYSYVFDTYTDNADNVRMCRGGSGATAGSCDAQHFGWNAGFGVLVDNFRFDGSLQHGWLTQGPDVIGGDSALWTMLSGSYSF